MTNTMRKLGRTALAGVAVAGISFATTAVASAVGPDQDGAPTEGTLTIHKYAGSPTGAPNDGTELTGADVPDSDLLGGVGFTATRVGAWTDNAGTLECVAIDLTDPAGWDAAESVLGAGATGAIVDQAAAAAGDLCATTAEVTGTTNNDEGSPSFGQLTWNLDLGLYYVEETAPGDNNIIEVATPFFVTIPLPTVTGEGDAAVYDWNYNVHVYPKNQIIEQPQKEISERPADLVTGSEVTWTITGVVPTLNGAGETFTDAVLRDKLNDRLTYSSSIVTVGGVVVYSDDSTPVDEDGIVGLSTDADGDHALWTFTDPAGLAFLHDNQGEDIVITLNTQVTGVGEITNGGDGENNPADFTFNGTTVPTTIPHTYWGQLAISKVDESNPATVLANAEFAVVELPAGATECVADLGEQPTVATGVSDDEGVVQWTTSSDSGVSPLGLWVANSNNELTDPAKDYCVYETQAPAGYTATGVRLVTISAGDLTTDSDLVWENPQKDGPGLPVTGGAGTILMSLGGLALVGLGVGTVLLARKRNHAVA